jgi:hypothetical protein
MKKIIIAALLTVLTLLAPLYISMANPAAQAATYPSTINFSGYTWYIENSNNQKVNPGPNYWSNSPQNVWVDANGYLHLKITYSNDKWSCAELTCTQTFGYGTYVYYVASRVDNFDKNVILGLFAYKDDSHEVDIEFSRWGNSTYKNGWYTAQPSPYVEGRNQRTFNFQLYGDYTTHYFIWRPNSVYFESFGGHYTIGQEPQGNIIQSFTSNSHVSATGVKAHINLWLYHGLAPSNGSPVEVVIKSFQYKP